MNMTIRQRILLSFGLILAAMLFMGGMVFLQLKNVRMQEQILTQHSLPGLAATNMLRITWVEQQLLLEEHGLAADQATKDAIEAQMRTARAMLDKALLDYKATIFTNEDRKRFEKIAPPMATYFQALPGTLQLSRDGGVEGRDFIRVQMGRHFDQVLAVIAGIRTFHLDRANAAARNIGVAVPRAQAVIGTSVLLTIVLAVLIGFYLLRAITRPLQRLTAAVEVMSRGDFSGRLGSSSRDEFGVLAQGYDRMSIELSTVVGQIQGSGIQVSSSINEIAATLREQEATAVEIAATTTQIGATSRQIATTSKELVRTMGAVATGAEQTAALAGDGQVGLAQMEQTMGRVMEATALINAKLAVLTEKADNISLVVTAITKVADQTNLLSLNAAIEAEKAGEYGRGFSVVATEIRRLADQTAVSTLDIEQMVREIQSAVSAGVMGMDKFSEEVRLGTHDVSRVGDQLSQMIQHVQAMVPSFEAVNDGVQAQATGAEQITQALTQLGEAAQQTVDTLRQSNLAVDELHQVSTVLRDGVSKFKLQG